MSDVRDAPVTVDEPAAPKRPVWVRVVRGFAWTCLWLGVFLLGFVVHQLFVTTWFAQRNNAELADQAEAYFAEAEVTEVVYREPGAPDLPVDPNEPPPVLLVEAPPPDHQAFAIIRIPTIDRLKDGWTVVEGVTRADLKNGAGHMTSTPLPGQPGNAVISGHRTTYGAPFHEIDELEPGDLIEVETALGVHSYAVRESTIVKPTELWVTADRPGAWLTLTTCNPKYSSRQRYIVFAELVDGPNAAVIVG